MSLNAKNIIILGFIITLLVAIPVTVYILQKQQQTESKAVASTTLCYTQQTDSTCLNDTNKLTPQINDTFSIDVFMKPGTNNVIASTLNISYDPTKIATTGAGLVRSADAFPSVIEGPVYTNDGTTGNISITMSVGIDLTKVIKTDTKIATLTFKALSPTGPTGTQVKFTNDTTITSTVSDPETNVLSTSTPATIVIGGAATPTPTTIQATATPTTPASTPGPTTPNTPPVCASLNIDRAASGSAPFSITFTAVGNDSDGTIQKATFNYGDGPVEDVAVGGGIGTNAVSVQRAHTYNNAGTFTARTVLTDNRNGISGSDTCTQAITVEAGAIPTGGSAQPTDIPTPTFTSTPTPTAKPLPSPGANGAIVGIGAGAIILTIIGGLLFLAL